MKETLGLEMLRAVEAKLKGQVLIAQANLKNLLTNAVGIGEHVNLTEDVETLLSEITDASDILATTMAQISELSLELNTEVATTVDFERQPTRGTFDIKEQF